MGLFSAAGAVTRRQGRYEASREAGIPDGATRQKFGREAVSEK